jgi:hypothetical protein
MNHKFSHKDDYLYFLIFIIVILTAIFLLINIININFTSKSQKNVTGGNDGKIISTTLEKKSIDDSCDKILKKNIDYEGYIFK